MEPSNNKKKIRRKGGPPAIGIESRENQLIAKAVDLAEKQLNAGTASAQVITHYLKLGSTQAQLEKEKLAIENDLLKAKIEALQSQKRIEEVYLNALNAMRVYTGKDSQEENLNNEDENY